MYEAWALFIPLTLQGHPLERYNIPKVQEFTNIFQNHTADYIASPTDSHSFDLLLVLLWESERHQCCCFVVLFSWCINKNLLANAWCQEKGCIIVFATRKLCALLAFICLKLRSNRNQPLNQPPNLFPTPPATFCIQDTKHHKKHHLSTTKLTPITTMVVTLSSSLSSRLDSCFGMSVRPSGCPCARCSRTCAAHWWSERQTSRVGRVGSSESVGKQ